MPQGGRRNRWTRGIPRLRKPSDRRHTEIVSIDVFGNRAVVTCVVSQQSAGGIRRYHNIRLFVRHDGDWRLLGWANEPE
jgi:hypothetical protein